MTLKKNICSSVPKMFNVFLISKIGYTTKICHVFLLKYLFIF